MALDARTLEHIAWLARLKLSDEEKEKFSKQLSDVLEMFSKVSKASDNELEPAFHAVSIEARAQEARKDEPKKWEWDPLGNAKHKEGGFIKSPKIV